MPSMAIDCPDLKDKVTCSVHILVGYSCHVRSELIVANKYRVDTTLWLQPLLHKGNHIKQVGKDYTKGFVVKKVMHISLSQHFIRKTFGVRTPPLAVQRKQTNNSQPM